MNITPLPSPVVFRRFLFLTWLFLLALSPAVAQTRVPIPLASNAKGSAAIGVLGGQLPAVAQAYGLTPQRLTTLLQTQRALGVDRDGLLLFACDAPPYLANLASSETENSAPAPLAAGTDALKLHSFPGATRVIYLDFDGHVTSGTQWNIGFLGGAPINSVPFDLDGVPGSFNDAELAVIRAVWQRVAEDYASFAVDVTTEDPGIEALRKTGSSDTVFGVRAVISPTNWYSTGASGIGYLGSFSWDSDTPCFVFTQQLANSAKNIAETASHELGHTLKLYHDGASGASATEYYLGHGNWAPIMGAGFYRPITQFSRGEYANANNPEDDLSIIATFVPYASDDHGDTPATASPLSGTTIADGGTIERATDVDMFRFTTSAGTVALSIQSPTPEGNLDIRAELLDANSQVVQTSDPGTLSASISASVSAGTYYLRIRGTGAGDPLTTGYSNYGSIGNYVLTGTLPSGTTPQAPTAVANASVTSGTAPLTLTFSSQGSADSDGSIVSYHWAFGNGDTSAAPNPLYTYNTAGTFTATLTVTDNTGLTGSASVTIAVSSSGGNVAPTITTQPVSQAVATASNVTFTAAASGTPAPTVQWYRNGVTFAGWNSPSLTLYWVTPNDAGTYTAVFTNAAGSVTSAPATLTIGSSGATNTPPAITTQPVSQTVNAGATVTFNAAASGSPSPTYQWRRNGTAIAGATTSALSLANVGTSDAGDYTLVASNIAGTATSNVAVLTVTNTPTGNTAPVITTQPVSQTAAPMSTVSFTVAATGSPAPTVKWYRNGITFAGWTDFTLVLPSLTVNDVGTYTAVVSNSAGSVTSSPATLTLAGGGAVAAQ